MFKIGTVASVTGGHGLSITTANSRPLVSFAYTTEAEAAAAATATAAAQVIDKAIQIQPGASALGL